MRTHDSAAAVVAAGAGDRLDRLCGGHYAKRMGTLRATFCCLMLATLCACGPSQLEVQAANDFSCTPEQLTVGNLGYYREMVQGCGNQDVYLFDHQQGRWVAARERAAFDLSCAKTELTVTMLDSATLGITGCGQKAVYKIVPMVGFVLDSKSAGGPAAPAAPAPAP